MSGENAKPKGCHFIKSRPTNIKRNGIFNKTATDGSLFGSPVAYYNVFALKSIPGKK
jgi:hypothetical protein